jgi:hypothetical protein
MDLRDPKNMACFRKIVTEEVLRVIPVKPSMNYEFSLFFGDALVGAIDLGLVGVYNNIMMQKHG